MSVLDKGIDFSRSTESRDPLRFYLAFYHSELLHLLSSEKLYPTNFHLRASYEVGQRRDICMNIHTPRWSPLNQKKCYSNKTTPAVKLFLLRKFLIK